MDEEDSTTMFAQEMEYAVLGNVLEDPIVAEEVQDSTTWDEG